MARLETILADLTENGWASSYQPLAPFHSGERNKDQLYQNLDDKQSAILLTVLSRLG